MREHHVIARPRSNGTVLMHHVISNPRMGLRVHRVTFSVSDSFEAIIWWPERLTLEVETAQNAICVQALKDRFQGNTRTRSAKS
jgi:hypothetical protein